MRRSRALPVGILKPYERTLERHCPYVVAVASLQRRLAASPLGLEIPGQGRIDPTRRDAAPFLRLLERLDALTYGPLNLAMPRWAFYDCAELPGIIFGLGRRRSDVPAGLAGALGVPDDYSGVVPVSMCMAVPTLEEHHWLTYALCDLSEALPTAAASGLRLLSLALALDLLAARRVTGTTQWASPKLRVHARFAPLWLRAAWVPAHTEPATCTFRYDVDPERIAHALRTEPFAASEPAARLDVADAAALRALQEDLEGGRRVAIAGPPEERGALLCVPLHYGGHA
jgi:hypothetical protein